MNSHSVTFDNRLTVPLLQAKVKEYITVHIPRECEMLAKAAGHCVIYTPPYHSDLQPIELVWARVKGNVGRQYQHGVTLEQVLDRLVQEFETLEHEGHEAIGKMISKTTTLAQKMFQEATQYTGNDELNESSTDASDSETETENDDF